MGRDNIILTTSVFDQGDILEDFIEWYLDLGVDFILVEDCGSTDGSQEMLDRFASHQRLRWFVRPERNMLKYNPALTLAQIARDQYHADWIFHFDADEFLSSEGRELRTILADAKADDVAVLNVPCFNMVGPLPTSGQRATQVLTLRIDRPEDAPNDAEYISGTMPAPLIFIKLPPKTIVLASAFVGYGPGMHSATSARGRQADGLGLQILHYPMRRFDKMQEKVRNIAVWLADNPQLEPWYAWHWRRLVRLDQEHRLKEDFESQFVSPKQAQALVRDGICTIDETVSHWLHRKRPRGLARIARRLFGASRGRVPRR